MNYLYVNALLILSLSVPVLAQSQSVTEDRVTDELVQKFLPPSIIDSKLQDILDALNAEQFDKALELANRVIALGPDGFERKFYGYHVVSASQYYAARASLQLGMDSNAIRFYIDSINNGNSGSSDEFAELLFNNKIVRLVVAIDLKPEELLNVLRNSAHLGSGVAAAFIAFGDLPLPVSERESIYWALMSVAGDKNADKERRQEFLSQMISKTGSEEAEDIFEEYSLTGGVIRTRDFGLPARGLLESLFIENNLLGSIGLARAGRHEPNEVIPQAPTIRESFTLNKGLFSEFGFGRPYILLPGDASTNNGDIVNADPVDIISHIRPGDRVYSRCGSLSHVSIVFRVDEAAKTVEFIDPAYQFWLPSHNQCIESAVLKESGLGKFVSVIPKGELLGVLTAVMTFRDER